MIIEFSLTLYLSGSTPGINAGEATFHGHADTVKDAENAVAELTAAIGGMQAPGRDTIYDRVVTEVKELKPQAENALAELTPQAGTLRDRRNEEAPNVQPDTTSGQQSAPTGESSSPTLDYDKDVKTVTLALSKAKGPETTKAILAKFDVASAKQLVADQWADYIAACNEALA